MKLKVDVSRPDEIESLLICLFAPDTQREKVKMLLKVAFLRVLVAGGGGTTFACLRADNTVSLEMC